MIFVTVGTHEQAFDRLIKEVDCIKEKGLKDEVFIQTGYSNYIPSYCHHKSFLTYDEMAHYINKADIIITHGGPATFMSVIADGKTPIVVPRLSQYGEHINDHQLEFALRVKKEGYNIEIVEDISELQRMVQGNVRTNTTFNSHNSDFMNLFNGLIKELVDES